MRYRYAALFSLFTCAITACGGGSSAPPTPPAPATQITRTASVGPTGGSVAATLGAQTVTVTVPAGALSAAGTVAVTVYAASAFPKAIRSAGRQTRGVGSDAAIDAEFSVTVSGATLLKPLQASVLTPAAPTGSIFRLAGFGTQFNDVDTVTYAGTTATSDLNVAWPRMSLAANTVYAFIHEPQAEAGVPAPVVHVASNATGAIAMFGTATYTATEADANGFPYLDPTFAFALDSFGSSTIDHATGAFTAGSLDQGGNVVATDTTAGRGNPIGKLAFSVSSQRPGNLGDTFTFSGTLISTTQLTSSQGTTQPQTDSASVTLTTTIQAGIQGATQIKTVAQGSEVDTFPLQTIRTKTDTVDAYTQTGAQTLVSTLSSDAIDSNGVEVIDQYGQGNGLIDVLPETPGQFGPNTAALVFTEKDPANFTRVRTVAADGTYVETGTDSLGDVQTISVNPDLSATYDASQYTGLKFSASAPTGTPPIVTVTVQRASGATLATFPVPSWYPAGTTRPSSETDLASSGVTYPVACNVPTKYGTAGNQLVQTINRVDPVLGNIERQTTTTYLANGVGPVCIQLNDATQTFYDYTGQFGFIFLASKAPIQVTTVTETLTLQSASTANGTILQAVKRAGSAASSRSSLNPSTLAPVAFARSRFEHAVRTKLNWMRKETFNTTFLSHGVRPL